MKNCRKKIKKKIAESRYFTKTAGAGAKCDHLKLGVRTHVRADLNMDVRGACVQPKKRSQLTPWRIAYLPEIKYLLKVSKSVLPEQEIQEMCY